MMKATPTASFKMAETQFLFQFLIIALDDPALFAQGDQIAQPAVFRQIGHPVLSGFGFLTGPLDQQPFLFSRLAELVIAMCGANAHGGKTGAQEMARAFSPGHGLPCLCRQVQRQLLGRYRCMLRVAGRPRPEYMGAESG